MILFRKKKEEVNNAKVTATNYGFMHVVDMRTEISSLSLSDGYVIAVATFIPKRPTTINPGDTITLEGSDGSIVYQTQETVSQMIDIHMGDSLELTIKLKPHGLMDVERWVLV